MQPPLKSYARLLLLLIAGTVRPMVGVVLAIPLAHPTPSKTHTLAPPQLVLSRETQFLIRVRMC